MNKLFGHIMTVHRHRKEVRRLCFKCGLYWQGIVHDLSKYSPIEFFNGVKYYSGDCSPHHGEREARGYSKAWMHHYKRNKHHSEYWNDHGPVEMPDRYIFEMFCDRIAASKIYMKDKYTDGSPIDYYNKHVEEHTLVNWQNDFLIALLTSLSLVGEDQTCEMIKTCMQQDKQRRKDERRAKRKEKG